MSSRTKSLFRRAYFGAKNYRALRAVARVPALAGLKRRLFACLDPGQ